eukprot:gb/GECH01001251.1/.p1 GENE.gb/GECH01001251.1/~~gb/GECH01001251.1/.p1  ORF type:complete len:466 (+),score=125.45 gb/GECH01001251.1/:1-1398(+)
MSKVSRVLYREISKLGRSFDANAARKALLIKKEGTITRPAQQSSKPSASTQTQDEIFSKCFSDFMGSESALLYMPGRYLRSDRSTSLSPSQGSESSENKLNEQNENNLLPVIDQLDDTRIQTLAREWFHKPIGSIVPNESLQDRYSAAFKTVKRLNEALHYSKNVPRTPMMPLTNDLPVKLLHPMKGLNRARVLVSHPLVSSIFNQSCVLLVDYGKNQGALGVVINRWESEDPMVQRRDNPAKEEQEEKEEEEEGVYIGGPVHGSASYYLFQVTPIESSTSTSTSTSENMENEKKGEEDKGSMSKDGTDENNDSNNNIEENENKNGKEGKYSTSERHIARQQLQVTDDIYFSGSKLSDIKKFYKRRGFQLQHVKKFRGVSTWTYGQLEREVREGSWLVTEMPTQTFFAKGNESKGMWPRVLRMIGGEYADFASFGLLRDEDDGGKGDDYDFEDEPGIEYDILPPR